MPTMPMPEKGISRDDLMARLHALKAHDADWRRGRMFGLIYQAGGDLEEVIDEVYRLFLFENGLSPMAFPSLLQMENEFVAMAAGLMGGGPEAAGCMTAGGTESIFMAIKAAREWARSERPDIVDPEMVVPVTVHPAWNKAAHYLGLKIVLTPVDEDFRADVEAMREAVTDRTIIVGGTAVTYPHGMIDPIDRIGELARERNLWLHVDACLGGYILAFLRRLGLDLPPFDFAVPGVKSLSVDIHKYGFIPKGASTVLYRNETLRRHQFFVYTDWPGGVYATPSLSGARPGGPIAAAWSVFHFLGEEGFLKLARTARDATVRLMDGIRAIPELYVLGRPPATVFAFGSDQVNIFEVGARMKERGWHLDFQHRPASLHMTVSPAHGAVVEPFLEDIREAVRAVSGVKPENLSQEAAMYGMMGGLPDRTMARDFALSFLTDLYRLK